MMRKHTHFGSSTAPAVPRAASRWLTVAALSLLLLAGSYLAAVWTAPGQALENAALRGADQVSTQDMATATEALDGITISSLAVAVVLVGLIAVLRRRLDLAVAGIGVIVLGQVITQGLKRFILPRPALVDVIGDYTHNSFPSGHTTIAMTVLFAVLIVVPYRWRGVALFVVLTWAVGIGAYTVTAKWHRLSDTIGADAVALLCACLASWWLAHRGGIDRYTSRAHRGRVALVVLIAVFTAVALILGAILWGVPLSRGVGLVQPDITQDYTAYLGAHSFAAGFSGLAALTFWGLWHRLETRPGNTTPPASSTPAATHSN